jgi:predicted metalloprotease
MKYNPLARLDVSSVLDRRGGRAAVGGGGLGLLGLIAYILFNVFTGGNAGSVLGNLGDGQSANNTQLASECKTGQDANEKLDCAVVADINSIQQYWTTTLPSLGARYTSAPTVWYTNGTQTACGSASSGMGPFYCPADQTVYIDLSFYQDLQTKYGAQGGPFVDAYVLAHEYGHHVQDLLGTTARVKPGDSGPTSGSVRLELQADCYAGVWTNHATTVPDASGQPLITEITQDDINRALDTAGRIGDDYIQTNLGNGRVNQSQFTHGTSEQRQRWFMAGYRSGDPRICNTFGTNNL